MSSGKSALARQLARDLVGVEVVSLDDFFLTASRRRASVWAKNYDLDRLQMQVLEPLLEDREIRYHPFDWTTLSPSRNFVQIPKGTKVIIDGTYSLDLRLRHCYDFSIWIDTPEAVRLTRRMDNGLSHEEALMQDGVEELTYVTALEPRSYASLVLKGISAFPPTEEILSRLADLVPQSLHYTQRASGQGI